MPIQDRRTELAGVPVRLCFRGDPAGAGARGTVLFYHGLFADIAGQTKELHSLAAAGLLAVGVDAVGHGARRWSDLEERLRVLGRSGTFEQIVKTTVAEIPGLVDALEARGWVRPGGLGLGGISMGGFVAYAAVLREPRLSAVTPILGSPVLDPDDAASPHHNPDAFPPVALLAQNAGDDQSVPPAAAREFHQALRPGYAATPERLAYVEFAGCEHFMPEDRWTELWDQVLAWYLRFLPGP